MRSPSLGEDFHEHYFISTKCWELHLVVYVPDYHFVGL